MGMVVKSGNDATVALAEYVAGSEDTFVQLMNQEAERLELQSFHQRLRLAECQALHVRTRYRGTHTRAHRDFPEHYPRYGVRSFKYNNIEQPNRNQLLLTDPSVDWGLKDRTYHSAGYCLVFLKRNDMPLISVVLGGEKEKERFQASETLLNYGFSLYESRKLHDAHSPVLTTGFGKDRKKSWRWVWASRCM